MTHLNLGACHFVNNFDDVAIELSKYCKYAQSVCFTRVRDVIVVPGREFNQLMD